MNRDLQNSSILFHPRHWRKYRPGAITIYNGGIWVCGPNPSGSDTYTGYQNYPGAGKLPTDLDTGDFIAGFSNEGGGTIDLIARTAAQQAQITANLAQSEVDAAEAAIVQLQNAPAGDVTAAQLAAAEQRAADANAAQDSAQATLDAAQNLLIAATASQADLITAQAELDAAELRLDALEALPPAEVDQAELDAAIQAQDTARANLVSSQATVDQLQDAAASNAYSLLVPKSDIATPLEIDNGTDATKLVNVVQFTRKIAELGTTEPPTNSVPTFDTTIADIAIGLGNSIYVDTGSRFTDAGDTLSFSIDSGALPDGANFDSVTGIISGTPLTEATFAGIVIRASDIGGLSVVSNAFEIDITAAVASVGLLFQTNFDGDTGYTAGATNLWRLDANAPGFARPQGWDGYRATNGSGVAVTAGKGQGGSNGLELLYSGASQPTINLGLHLTKDETRGHDELYVRYNILLPDGFMVGDASNSTPYWKWLRFWQNTPTNGNGWSENRADSGFVVIAVGGSKSATGTSANRWVSTWAEVQGDNLDQGSAGGERVSTTYYVSGADSVTQTGYFENMGDGDGSWEYPINNGQLIQTPQSWHTIEFHCKLASSESAEDGIFEMWMDGVKVGAITGYGTGNALSGQPRQGLPTIRKGSGWNFFSFFDNMAGWNEAWDINGYTAFPIISDLVVSTDRIGHDYVVTGFQDNTAGSGVDANGAGGGGGGGGNTGGNGVTGLQVGVIDPAESLNSTKITTDQAGYTPVDFVSVVGQYFAVTRDTVDGAGETFFGNVSVAQGDRITNLVANPDTSNRDHWDFVTPVTGLHIGLLDPADPWNQTFVNSSQTGYTVRDKGIVGYYFTVTRDSDGSPNETLFGQNLVSGDRITALVEDPDATNSSHWNIAQP